MTGKISKTGRSRNYIEANNVVAADIPLVMNYISNVKAYSERAFFDTNEKGKKKSSEKRAGEIEVTYRKLDKLTR